VDTLSALVTAADTVSVSVMAAGTVAHMAVAGRVAHIHMAVVGKAARTAVEDMHGAGAGIVAGEAELGMQKEERDMVVRGQGSGKLGTWVL
jgi:hypothetical protein